MFLQHGTTIEKMLQKLDIVQNTEQTLQVLHDVVNVLIDDFGVIPTEETINDITSLSMYEDNEDDIEYEYEDEYEYEFEHKYAHDHEWD
jgi:hypothetical protein